jgi:hypothetical protein
MVWWLPVALIAPPSTRWRAISSPATARPGLDPVQVLLGACIVGAVMALPLALMTGQWISPLPPWGAPDLAILGSSFAHALGLFGLCLDGRPGGRGLCRAGVLPRDGLRHLLGLGHPSGETYSGWVWAAVALMFAGLFLVQPRPTARVDAGRLSDPAARPRKTSLAGGHLSVMMPAGAQDSPG